MKHIRQEKRSDIETTCLDILIIGDDYGDNECTFCCALEKGHDEPHRDEFKCEGKSVVIEWRNADEKEN